MKNTTILFLFFILLFIQKSVSQSMISGDTYEKRSDVMIQYMAKGTSPTGGDPKYTGPYYFARLYLNYDKNRALTQLETMYDRYIADPSLYYSSAGSGVEFYAHATLHGYLLTKDNMTVSLKAKIKTFLELGDYNSRGITLNLDMMRYTVGFLCAEQWSDFTDRYQRTNQQIRDYNRPRILNWLDKFFHNNCSEADAFIYFSTNLMYVRMLAEYAIDDEINRKANAVYQQMIASLVSAWNNGLYIANPPRCKGWDQLYTGSLASGSNITALSWLYFGDPDNKYLFVPGLTVSNNTASINFWLAYKRNVAPLPSLLSINSAKQFPYVYTSYINDIYVNINNQDNYNWKRFKYTYQSANYGLATQTEIPYNLSNANSCYAYKETKRTYLAWQSDVLESVFSVCQDNPERPTDNVNINIVGYGENPYQRVMQYKKTAIGVYNVPTTYLQGKRYRLYVPFTQKGIKVRTESDGWVFCHTGTMLFAFKSLEPYTWASSRFNLAGHDVLTLQDTLCRKGAWVLETSEIFPKYKSDTQAQELDLFKSDILTSTSITKINYISNTPTIKYASLDGDTLQLEFFAPTVAYNNQYVVNNTPLALSEEYLFNSPYIKQKNNSDEVSIYYNDFEDKIYWEKQDTKVDINKNDNSYSIFPNPVKETLHLRLPNDNKSSEISILNILGQIVNKVNTQPGQNDIIISVDKLKQGAFFLSINHDKKISVMKFLKQ